jgi:hypothetical protein
MSPFAVCDLSIVSAVGCCFESIVLDASDMISVATKFRSSSRLNYVLRRVAVLVRVSFLIDRKFVASILMQFFITQCASCLLFGLYSPLRLDVHSF